MPEGVHRLVASASGAPVGGIETVTGGPVRCMNRSSGWLAYWPPVRPEPSHDRSAQRRRCPRRSRGLRGGVHRPDVSQRLRAPAAATPAGCRASSSRQLGLPIRLDRTAGQDHRRRSAPACTASPATSACRGWTSPRANARTTSLHEHLARFTEQEGVLFIGRAQEKTDAVPHRTRRNADGDSLPVDRALHRRGQPLLRLRRGRRLRPVLPQVLHLLPLHRQAVPVD